MESKGWEFDVDVSMRDDEKPNCGDETWYGWTGSEAVGSIVLDGSGPIQTVLDGTGMVTMNYGNCYSQGLVNVYLNGNLISSAIANVKNKIVKFSFSNGDVLNITEEFGIIKLNYFEIACTGKYYIIMYF